MRVRPATVMVTALVLVLAGCGPGPEPPREPPSPTPSPSRSAEPPTTPQPDPDTAAPEGPTLPPELAARMPPEEEIDGLVLEAEAAYVDHRAAYDAAARTGFTDPDLVEELVATATGDVREALEVEAAAIAEAGRLVDGGAEVLGMELHSLLVPEADGTGFGVALDVCLRIEGALEESDGTVVYELDGDPVHLVVRLTDHEGTWLVASQSVQEGPCPEGLGP
ncbi:hypothetical protein SAMN05216184_101186 [Georgenia satyanarayanai]|uniref:Uncharacterized protein n=1 Tax=Georgenia satyanarayanai TaxID=860221 RepID=A0A2Y9BUZ5_9MICO|nr:hypothetical protein [Georgenia satyanarayanai]PYG01722.1 hypothetical protein A8987_101186 [Georgenia satyanarayanai]SSA36522.1 hypothetical protein SAMN05216184_101186 [Georgenia satyanarayanai]